MTARQNKHSSLGKRIEIGVPCKVYCGSVALSSSLFGGVGSNPTAASLAVLMQEQCLTDSLAQSVSTFGC